jgi:hypothetical protein
MMSEDVGPWRAVTIHDISTGHGYHGGGRALKKLLASSTRIDTHFEPSFLGSNGIT